MNKTAKTGIAAPAKLQFDRALNCWLVRAKSLSTAFLCALLISCGLLFPATPAAAAVAFVQGNYNVADPATTRTVNYTGAQTAGNLNVVIVGWFNSTTTVTSVTDTKGNVYTRAVGPTLAASATQSIYYAKNIAAATPGANTVTVVFSASAPLVDVRIAEYRGIDTASPLDVVSGATGTGTALNSGSATTATANELIVGGNVLESSTSAPGSSFTQRMFTSALDILEDRVVTSVGSYNATATQDASGWWIMQMAAFKAASNGGDTQAPSTPTNLSGTTASSSQINLSWTAATDNVAVTGYLIERCQGPTAGCTSFIPAGSSSTTTFNDTGLSPSTVYNYRIRARDAANNTSASYSSTASATTQAAGTSSIAYVQGNSNTPDATSTITVNYSSAQTAGNLNVVVVAWYNTTSTVTAVTDSKGNTYALAVGPTRAVGIGDGTGSQSIYYAKNIVGASAGSNTVTVTLNASAPHTDVRIAEYSGIDKTNPLDGAIGADGMGTDLNSNAITTTNANDLLIGADYAWGSTINYGTGFTQRILTGEADILEDRIVTTAGSYTASATQDEAQFWTMQIVAFKAQGVDTQAPTAPTNLTATVVSGTQINLSWTASTDNVGVTSYQVERCAGASCSTFGIVGTPTGTTFNDTGLTGLTTYRYRVLAKDAANNPSAYSTVINASTPEGQPPSTPSNLVATAVSSTQINLSWTASTDNVGVSSYQVERCTGSGCTNFATIGSPTVTTLNNTGLTALTLYRYRVLAKDAAGNASGYSTIVNQTTLEGQPPSTPTNLAATVISSTQINLSWTGSTDNVGVTGYQVERCTGASCSNFAIVGTPTGTTFNNTGLTGNTLYRYRVAAKDAANNLSGYSNIVNPTTQQPPVTLNPPTGLNYTAISNKEIDLSWVASTSSGVTGYIVEHCSGTGCTFTAIAGSPTSATVAFDSSLSGGTSYSYRVRAQDGQGNQSTNATLTVSTLNNPTNNCD